MIDGGKVFFDPCRRLFPRGKQVSSCLRKESVVQLQTLRELGLLLVHTLPASHIFYRCNLGSFELSLLLVTLVHNHIAVFVSIESGLFRLSLAFYH